MNFGDILFLVYMSLIFFFGSSLNLMLILVYRKYPSNYSSIWLIASLAFFNFISSILVVPFVVVHHQNIYAKSDIYCGAYSFMQYLINSTPVILLFLIAFERLRNILISTHAKFHFLKAYNSKTAVLSAILFSLVFSSFAFFCFKINNKNNKCYEDDYSVYTIVSVAILILVFILLCAIYVQVYIIVAKSSKRVSDFSSKNNKLFNATNFLFNKSSNLISNQVLPDDTNIRAPVQLLKFNSKATSIRKDWKIAKKFILVYF
jgi:hypothetical protein